MSAGSRPFDTHIEIITPENITFHYRVAGPFRRLPAYLIDVALQLAAVAAAAMALMFVFGRAAPGLVTGVMLVAWFILSWFYGGLFEALWNGQTPGKRMMQIRVLSVDGQPINGLQAVLRNLLRTVDALPVVYHVVPLYLLGLCTTAMNERYQRLGDLACGTMVVVEEPQHRYGVVRIVEPEALALASALPASFEASRDLSLALSSYVLRRNSFSWGRRTEIARHVGEPLRVRFGLPADTSYDLLLCALYHKTFFGNEADEPPAGASPFAETNVVTTEAVAG